MLTSNINALENQKALFEISTKLVEENGEGFLISWNEFKLWDRAAESDTHDGNYSCQVRVWLLDLICRYWRRVKKVGREYESFRVEFDAYLDRKIIREADLPITNKLAELGAELFIWSGGNWAKMSERFQYEASKPSLFLLRFLKEALWSITCYTERQQRSSNGKGTAWETGRITASTRYSLAKLALSWISCLKFVPSSLSLDALIVAGDCGEPFVTDIEKWKSVFASSDIDYNLLGTAIQFLTNRRDNNTNFAKMKRDHQVIIVKKVCEKSAELLLASEKCDLEEAASLESCLSMLSALTELCKKEGHDELIFSFSALSEMLLQLVHFTLSSPLLSIAIEGLALLNAVFLFLKTDQWVSEMPRLFALVSIRQCHYGDPQIPILLEPLEELIKHVDLRNVNHHNQNSSITNWAHLMTKASSSVEDLVFESDSTKSTFGLRFSFWRFRSKSVLRALVERAKTQCVAALKELMTHVALRITSNNSSSIGSLLSGKLSPKLRGFADPVYTLLEGLGYVLTCILTPEDEILENLSSDFIMILLSSRLSFLDGVSFFNPETATALLSDTVFSDLLRSQPDWYLCEYLRLDLLNHLVSYISEKQISMALIFAVEHSLREPPTQWYVQNILAKVGTSEEEEDVFYLIRRRALTFLSSIVKLRIEKLGRESSIDTDMDILKPYIELIAKRLQSPTLTASEMAHLTQQAVNMLVSSRHDAVRKQGLQLLMQNPVTSFLSLTSNKLSDYKSFVSFLFDQDHSSPEVAMKRRREFSRLMWMLVNVTTLGGLPPPNSENMEDLRVAGFYVNGSWVNPVADLTEVLLQPTCFLTLNYLQLFSSNSAHRALLSLPTEDEINNLRKFFKDDQLQPFLQNAATTSCVRQVTGLGILLFTITGKLLALSASTDISRTAQYIRSIVTLTLEVDLPISMRTKFVSEFLMEIIGNKAFEEIFSLESLLALRFEIAPQIIQELIKKLPSYSSQGANASSEVQRILAENGFHTYSTTLVKLAADLCNPPLSGIAVQSIITKRQNECSQAVFEKGILTHASLAHTRVLMAILALRQSEYSKSVYLGLRIMLKRVLLMSAPTAEKSGRPDRIEKCESFLRFLFEDFAPFVEDIESSNIAYDICRATYRFFWIRCHVFHFQRSEDNIEATSEEELLAYAPSDDNFKAIINRLWGVEKSEEENKAFLINMLRNNKHHQAGAARQHIQDVLSALATR